MSKPIRASERLTVSLSTYKEVQVGGIELHGLIRCKSKALESKTKFVTTAVIDCLPPRSVFM
jgi:hypothetical protein